MQQETQFDAEEAIDAGLVTFAPDELDWDDELRLAIEERASLSPDALTGMEASLRFGGRETDRHEDLRPPVGLAELDLHPPERRRRAGRTEAVRQRDETEVHLGESVESRESSSRELERTRS